MESIGKLSSNKINRTRELDILYIITITAILLFFIFDSITKILFTYSFEFHRASLLIRTSYELLFIIVSISLVNHVRASIFTMLLFLFFIFLIGQFLLPTDVRGFLSENLITFNKYIFIFIIYSTLYPLQSDDVRLNKCINLVENIFLLNSIAVLIGPLTGWEFLKTYVNADYRHGYMGFIMAQNEATLFYFLAVSLAYYKRFILKTRSFKFYIILSASLLLGTKGIYLYLVLLLFFHNFFYAKQRLLLILAIGVALLQLYRYSNTEEGRIFFVYFYNESLKADYISMLLSGRDILLKTSFFGQLDKWSFLNYLFGGQNVVQYATELDFFDLFLFFGLIGSVVYMTLSFTTLFKFKNTKFTLFFVGCYFVLAFFGGHFFTSALNGIYLCLIAMYIYSNQIKGSLQF